MASIAKALGISLPSDEHATGVTGITLNSKAVEPGDLYVALPGSSRHGADFVPQAVDAGAVAIVTDDAGARQLA
ncbi:Mur ligase domain-containing protein, partial [Burkholderia sp. SIMBA_057]